MSEQGVGGIHDLFGSFDGGELDTFLSGCTNDLVLTVRGSGPRTTIVRRSEIPEWYRSMQALTGATLRSTVCLALIEGNESTVVLRHTLERNGLSYQYETWNLCTFRQKLLAAWFCYPVSLLDYARAWDIRKAAALQMV